MTVIAGLHQLRSLGVPESVIASLVPAAEGEGGASTGDPAWKPALVTIPNVELLEVGRDWECSTGIFTWTEDHLKAAVASQDDPAVRTPVIKLGHIDPRFDGQPAVGRIINMRTTNNGQTLVGDLAGVPVWLAEVMASAYPRRSIEGQFDYETRTGNNWSFALTALALLGTAYPAINTLEDVQALYGATPPVLVPVGESVDILATDGPHFRAIPVQATPVAAATTQEVDPMTEVMAGTTVSDISTAFYDQFDGPTYYWWWIRDIRVSPAELIVDDDEGHLWRIPYTISSDDEIEFAEAIQIKVEYVDLPVAAGQKVAASWKNPGAAGRPKRGSAGAQAAGVVDSGQTAREDRDVQLTDEALRALGLEPGADEEAINQAILTRSQAGEGTQDGDPTGGADTGRQTAEPGQAAGDAPPAGTETPPGGTATDTGAPPADGTLQVPAGMALVDAAALQETQQGLANFRAWQDQQVAAERNRTLDDAIKAGKFPRSRREHYEVLLRADPEGTQQLLQTMASNMVPVEEIGTMGGEADVNGRDEYPAAWAGAVSAARAATGTRVKVVND